MQQSKISLSPQLGPSHPNYAFSLLTTLKTQNLTLGEVIEGTESIQLNRVVRILKIEQGKKANRNVEFRPSMIQEIISTGGVIIGLQLVISNLC